MHNLRKREQTLCTLFIEPTPLLLNVSFPNMVLGFWLDFKSKLKRRNILNTSSPNLALGFWLNNLWKDFQLNSIYFAPALVLLWPWPWQMIYDHLFIIIYEKLFNVIQFILLLLLCCCDLGLPSISSLTDPTTLQPASRVANSKVELRNMKFWKCTFFLENTSKKEIARWRLEIWRWKFGTYKISFGKYIEKKK